MTKYPGETEEDYHARLKSDREQLKKLMEKKIIHNPLEPLHKPSRNEIDPKTI